MAKLQTRGVMLKPGGEVRAYLLMTTASMALLAAAPAHAQDATWLLNPGSGNFNTAANWTPAAIPTGTAFFGASNTTSVTISTSSLGSGNTIINRIQINAGAPAYTFTIPNGLFLTDTQPSNGGGVIINNSSFVPTFNITGNGSLSIDTSAANAIIINNGRLVFNGGSAENATITNNNSVQFGGQATGGAARFIQSAAGQIDLSFLRNTSGMTAGSIEGAGTIFLGSFNLAVGGNNLSTTFSGSLQTRVVETPLPAEVCERMRNEMEDRSSRRMRTLVTRMARSRPLR